MEVHVKAASTSYCNDDQFMCKSKSGWFWCISIDAVCDGTNDCSEGEDEARCGNW